MIKISFNQVCKEKIKKKLKTINTQICNINNVQLRITHILVFIYQTHMLFVSSCEDSYFALNTEIDK